MKLDRKQTWILLSLIFKSALKLGKNGIQGGKMILKLYPQTHLFENFAMHEIGQELRRISDWLDQHPEILDLASKDLIRVEPKAVGRYGLSVEAVVRCSILKQYHQWSYQELAFHLEDSQSCAAFARLDGRCPKKSVLQKTVTLLRAETWEAINRILLSDAVKKKWKKGTKSGLTVPLRKRTFMSPETATYCVTVSES
jgi:hypothetical protein